MTENYRIASMINNLTALFQGPAGNNSFVILDPNVASSTAKMLKNISKGLMGLGFAIDLVSQLADGESALDAVVKSGCHLGIAVVVGAVIGSIIPGPGTVAGAVVGLAVGTVVTYGLNTLFDYIYDDPEGFIEDVAGAWDKASEVISDVADTIGDAVSGFFGNIGSAITA